MAPKIMRKRRYLIKGLRDLIKWTGLKEIELLEIGSYAGESAEAFISSGKIKKIHCVDPWENHYDKNDPGSEKWDMAKIESFFDERAMSFPDGILEKYKISSQDASKKFKDKSLDIVYIDGNHQYEAVRDDINSWARKVKPGGFISGHDFFGGFFGVRKAVKEILGDPCNVFSDSSWIFSIEKIKDSFS